MAILVRRRLKDEEERTKSILVVVAAKSTSDASKTTPFPPDPNSPQSTISTVEREIKEAGGEATAVAVDTRNFSGVQSMVDKTIEVKPFRLHSSHNY